MRGGPALRVLLHAWHGATVGDTVLTELTAAWLRENFGAQVHYSNPQIPASAVEKFNVLILGPCGVVYDPGPPKKRDLYADYTDYMTARIFAAARAKIPVMAFNVGVMELLRRDKVEKWRRALNLCSLITTREEHTAEIFKWIGVEAPIEICSDLGYAVPGFTPKKEPGLQPWTIGVNFRQYYKNWYRALNVLRRSFRVKFMVFDQDEPRLAKQYGLVHAGWPSYNLASVARAYYALDYMVTSHLHSHVFATMAGTPFLQIYRGPINPKPFRLPLLENKNVWAMNDLGWLHRWDPREAWTLLVRKVKAMVTNDAVLRRRLTRIRNHMTPLATRNFELLRGWLQSQKF